MTFFSFNIFNIIAGIDDKGEGCVYGYDAIGSYERLPAGSQGSGQTLIQPLLDNQITFKNQKYVPKDKITLDETLNLVKDTFTSAGERDIYTGDSVEIFVITKKDGIKKEKFELKKD